VPAQPCAGSVCTLQRELLRSQLRAVNTRH